MARFMAVHTLPYTEAEFVDVMKGASERLSQLPPGVTGHRTYCDFADHKFFCDWEAPSKEVVEQIFKAMEVPFDAIYPVRLFDVAKLELEP